MKPKNTITVDTIVRAPMETVWERWTKPEHIVRWCFASRDWEAPSAENDLREGGRFNTAMAAKDGSAGFAFTGTYAAVKRHELIEYDLDDGRHVRIRFEQLPAGVRISETLEPENTNPEAMQRSGWQSILDNFRKYVETEK